MISIFDMLKVGVGPSSSHTLGPWRAAEQWINELKENNHFTHCKHIKIDLYGSLSLTGKGHATDIAVMLGLMGKDPITFDTNLINETIEIVNSFKILRLNNEISIPFSPKEDIIFNKSFLDYHPNGITFTAHLINGEIIKSTYFSIGGGFVEKEHQQSKTYKKNIKLPYLIATADELMAHCNTHTKNISEIVLANENKHRSINEINTNLDFIWTTMLESMYEGCHVQGFLPGGLHVKRRAFDINKKLIKTNSYFSPSEWLNTIRKTEAKFHNTLKWISCFALSVNEVNASLGRVVTAPTNGSAGVVPAVLMYYLCFVNKKAGNNEIRQFLTVAGKIGSLFKRNATISAAMGGCQAEIGVSSAMAAGALTELLGGTPEQVTIAAEIAMEHHLGLTCDPIGGLVQVPCIERNSMGAIKAINAAELALECDYADTKVSLDEVINTMWTTANEMNAKYKETSEGGLAVVVRLSDC